MSVIRTYVVALLIATASIICAGNVRADVPSVGYHGSLDGKYVVCDTLQQIKTIWDAGKDNNEDELIAKFRELSEILDDKDDLECVLYPVSDVTFGERIPLGLTEGPDGTKTPSYAINIFNETGDWWMLYRKPEGIHAD